jgi:hypothetical protein
MIRIMYCDFVSECSHLRRLKSVSAFQLCFTLSSHKKEAIYIKSLLAIDITDMMQHIPLIPVMLTDLVPFPNSNHVSSE